MLDTPPLIQSAQTGNIMENITFGTYTKPATVNPWDDVIAQMIENGPDTAVTYVHGDDDDDTRLIRASANAHNRTAKIVDETRKTVKNRESISTTFILVGKRGRKMTGIK